MTSSTLKGEDSMGRKTVQATAKEEVATAKIHSVATAFRPLRSMNSAATKPTMGNAISVAQKVKRSKVSTLKARPRAILATGVVPPSPSSAVTDQPINSGRKRRSEPPRKKIQGSARIRGLLGTVQNFLPLAGFAM